MIIFDDLNPFARRFAAHLFTSHPDWRTFASIPNNEDWDAGVLSVAVPSPVPNRELSIDTDGGEITVSFGKHGWHAHYWQWDDVDEATVFERALADIDGIVTEVLAILTGFLDGVVCSSETFWRGEEVSFKNSDRIEIVSWLGSRDATLFAA